jgi:hypothetical protein
MAPHDPAADVLEACRTDLHVLTPETAPCGGIREVRERIVGDLRRGQGFDGLYRQVVKRTERGGISYRMARDPELERLASAMRALCEHDLAHLATLEAPCHRVHPQDETPGPPPEP